ncbi:MAG: TIGR02996 domain-containing protein [Gemmataceae bacterium]
MFVSGGDWMARRKSAIQIAAARVAQAEERARKIEESIYQTFLSATSYRRAGRAIPRNHIQTHLDSQWGRYVGYAPRRRGTLLLRRLAWVNRVLAHRRKQRDAALAPRRERRAERTPPSLGGTRLNRPSGKRANNEELGFWHSLRRHPEDRNAWMAYADWLEEHEDPKTAREIKAIHGMSYIGTIDTQIHSQGLVAWRANLEQRGRVIPPGLLVALPCHRSRGRWKVMVQTTT